MAGKFNLFSQLFGSVEGHQINTEVDAIGVAFANQIGITDLSKEGLLSFADGLLEKSINSNPKIDPIYLPVIDTVLNKLIVPKVAPALSITLAPPSDSVAYKVGETILVTVEEGANPVPTAVLSSSTGLNIIEGSQAVDSPSTGEQSLTAEAPGFTSATVKFMVVAAE